MISDILTFPNLLTIQKFITKTNSTKSVQRHDVFIAKYQYKRGGGKNTQKFRCSKNVNKSKNRKRYKRNIKSLHKSNNTIEILRFKGHTKKRGGGGRSPPPPFS